MQLFVLLADIRDDVSWFIKRRPNAACQKVFESLRKELGVVFCKLLWKERWKHLHSAITRRFSSHSYACEVARGIYGRTRVELKALWRTFGSNGRRTLTFVWSV